MDKVPLPDLRKERQDFWNKQHAATRPAPKPKLTVSIWHIAAAAAAILFIGLFMGAYFFREAPVQVFVADNAPQNIRLKVEGITYIIDEDMADKISHQQGATITSQSMNLSNRQAKETPLKEQYQTLTTPNGQDYNIVLSDGTRVSLHAASRLDFPDVFVGKQRVVYLHGEGYFEVAPDEQHPFIVRTDYFETTVLGTTFNVCAYSPQDASVTLLEGKVKVTGNNDNESFLLYPHEQVSLQTDGRLQQQPADVYSIQEWQKGFFYFDDITLLKVMQKLGRWYNVDVIFRKKESMDNKMHFVANRNETLEKALSNLNALGIVKATFKDNQVIIE